MLCSKDHLERADELITAAHIFAVGMYLPFSDKFPEIEAVANSNLVELWDYLLFIASVGTAFMEIADTVPEKDQRGIACAVYKKLNDWSPNSYDAIKDFIKCVKKLLDSGVEVPDTIGFWIWANLGKQEQSNQQLKELASSFRLVRQIGLPILTAFHNWWKKE